MSRIRSSLGIAAAACSLAAAARAQANQDAGLDVTVTQLSSISMEGQTGVFPNGLNGIACATQICNTGTVEVPWEEPMDPDHPFIAFLIARELDGRFEQISDASYVKHGFNAQNVNCQSCVIPGGPPGDLLGVGCLDTYSVGTNGDGFWLAPPEEVDPWLGTWDPVCSHFDRGEPPVAPPQDCDGIRSLTRTQVTALGPVAHRVRVLDADLNEANGSYWYQGYYVVAGEPEANRADNLATRRFFPTWLGSTWSLAATGSLAYGSILQHWTSATLASNTNGADDGRVYVAVTVSEPVAGLYRYEYAVHNRDNSRGIGAFRVPTCPEARILNAGFHDVDGDPGTDWTVTLQPGEVVFSTTANALRWNTVYNFWFDSDALPVPAAVTLDQLDPGPGQPSFPVASRVPARLLNVHLGPGCSLAEAPSLYATGSPAVATIGNPSFGVRSAGNVPGQANFLFYSRADGSFPLAPGCTVWMGGVPLLSAMTTADVSGEASYALPIPSDPSLEGQHVNLQCAGVDPAGGPAFTSFELSAGLRVRIGSSLTDCP